MIMTMMMMMMMMMILMMKMVWGPLHLELKEENHEDNNMGNEYKLNMTMMISVSGLLPWHSKKVIMNMLSTETMNDASINNYMNN